MGSCCGLFQGILFIVRRYNVLGRICRARGKKQPKVVDSSAQITKIIPSTRMVVWLLYQYKSNLSSLLYKFYTQKPFEPSLVTMARGALRDGFG